MQDTTTHRDQHRLLELFEQHGGYLTSHEINRAKLPSMAVTRLLKHGLIERPQRGVYRLNDQHLNDVNDNHGTSSAEGEDLLELQLRFPHARPCLVSALHLHGLTTTRPSALQLAIPQNRAGLKIETPAIEVYYFNPKHYSTGLTTLEVRTRTLTYYSAEKTLCDLLRYAPKYGRELYLEGLKKYLHQHPSHQLIIMAKRLGVWGELGRDLEVLGHDQDH